MPVPCAPPTDGTILASASFDGLLRLWDTANAHCLKTLALDKDTTPVNFVCFSLNGGWLVMCCTSMS